MGACIGCGKGLCLDCLNKIDGKIYCDACKPSGTSGMERTLSRIESNFERQTVLVREQITAVTTTKRRDVAALLALFLGGFGVHKFYLGQIGWGLMYLFFSWTGIPTLAGWVEGLLFLIRSEDDFVRRFGRPTAYARLDEQPRSGALPCRQNSAPSRALPKSPKDHEMLLLDFARHNRGEISVARLMAEQEVNLDKVEDALARLAAKGLVENELDDQGRIFYYVPEFRED